MTQTKVEQRGTKHDTTVRTLTMFMQKYLSSLLLMLNYESCNNRSDMPPPWHATLNDGNSICFCLWLLPTPLSFFAVACNCGISRRCVSSVCAAVWLLCRLSSNISLPLVCFPPSFPRCRSSFVAVHEAEPTKSRHPPPCPLPRRRLIVVFSSGDNRPR